MIHLLADDSHEILSLIFHKKSRKKSQNLSAAVEIDVSSTNPCPDKSKDRFSCLLYMRGSRKFFQRGSKFNNIFFIFFSVHKEIEDPNTAINGPSSTRH